MKLYTEEQMKRCFNDAQMQWANYNFMYRTWDEYIIACNPPPIELPSNEEINESLDILTGMDKCFINGFSEGIDWVLIRIKQQADEN